MNDTFKREIWARGLTPSDIGKTVDFGDGRGRVLLKGIEHLGEITIATVTTVVEVSQRQTIRIYD